ncbi:Wadjet anti-phage system protein JetD domain-containing protein [Galactobacter valiniphilus]|uniref:Wadjet anti-phage system protein JetD domain-containing protein n=1 Tax=Galactobacter valiniphilus TaxID=2676122 RepID=UPI00373638E5
MPVGPAAARERARAAFSRGLRTWATDLPEAERALFAMPLHPPSERDALGDQEQARDWARSWERLGEAGVAWEERAWSRLGRQRVPVRLELLGADAIAGFAGQQAVVELARARQIVSRAEETLLGDAACEDSSEPRRAGTADAGEAARRARLLSVLRSQLAALLKLPDADVNRVFEFSRWIAHHPVSGRFLRQVPLAGVDTKWLERRKGMVTALIEAVSGSKELGLRLPEQLIRLRFLDPNLRVSGLEELAVPPSGAASLEIEPKRVLVVENLQTFLSLPSLNSTVAIFGAGYGAGRRIDMLPWVRQARVYYWGDLDSHGLTILHQFRSHVPQVTSVLMGADVLLANSEHWVAEPMPVAGTLSSLDRAEVEVLEVLRRHGNVRLEQERISWDVATHELKRVVEEKGS